MAKPIYIMNEPGISIIEKDAVITGIQTLLGLAIVKRDMVDYGAWNSGIGLEKKYQSVDWYLEQGRRKSNRPNQLRANTIVHLLLSEPWRQQTDHYDVLITHQDLYDEGLNFVVGSAIAHVGTVISVNRFRGLNEKLSYECIKTASIHEVGHVFGLPNPRRKDIAQSLGGHCINGCVMRQGLTVPTDWINMTRDRLRYGPLCRNCQADLLDHFRGY